LPQTELSRVDRLQVMDGPCYTRLLMRCGS
jgi:hypothetical protein